jgi:type IV pilus assembly protein PilX
MNTLRKEITIGTRQRGAVLVVSMLLLLVMTVLALSMSQTARLDERMAGNSRDYELAFQGSESALRAAEATLMASTDPIGCPSLTNANDPTQCPTLMQGVIATANVELRDADEKWWQDNSHPFGTSGKDMAALYGDPNVVIEEAGKVNFGGLDIGGPGVPEVRTFYKVTAHSFGKGSSTRVINESTVAVQPP